MLVDPDKIGISLIKIFSILLLAVGVVGILLLEL